MNDDYISAPSRTAEILKQYNLTLRKTLGQNFLIDANVLKKIAKFAELKKSDVILEVGAGIGSLTEIIVPNVKKIICVEMDRNIAAAFKEIFVSKIGRKVFLIVGDAMKLNYNEICLKYGISKFVANLPYKIAAPLILRILSQTDKIKDFYITIQKDIADRMLAKPGDRNYNAFTVKLNYFVHFIKGFSISKNCFYPKPFVDSVTIHLKRKDNFFPEKVMQKISSALISSIIDNNSLIINFTCNFFRFVEDCFSHRRKKLINSLILSSDHYKIIQDKLLLNLENMSFNKDVRPEELSLEDYLLLFISIKFQSHPKIDE